MPVISDLSAATAALGRYTAVLGQDRLNPGIARQHVFFDRSERTGAVITIQIDWSDPRPVIGLLRFLLLRTPLSARCALKVLGTLLGRQLL